MNIQMSEHVFIAGRTGSGKTYLAQKFLPGFPYVVAIDTKGTLKWHEIPGTKWGSKAEKRDHILLDGGKLLDMTHHLEELPYVETPYIIYRPSWDELNHDFFNEFFKWCYKRGNTVVWVDEVFSIADNPQRFPEYLKAILTRGREMNVPAWCLTQRPAGIPLFTISEATHVFCFELNLKADRQRMVEVTGEESFYKKPGKYHFWYYHMAESDHAIKAKLSPQ